MIIILTPRSFKFPWHALASIHLHTMINMCEYMYVFNKVPAKHACSSKH